MIIDFFLTPKACRNYNYLWVFLLNLQKNELINISKICIDSVATPIPVMLLNSFFDDVQSRMRKRPATLLKKRLWHTCFLVNFAKFLRTPFLTEHFQATAFLMCSPPLQVVNNGTQIGDHHKICKQKPSSHFTMGIIK